MKIIKQNLTAANNLGLESKAQFFSFFNGSEDLCKLHAEAKKIDAHVQIIERHQSLTSNKVLTNAVTEIFAAKSANVDCYKIQNDDLNASLVDNTYIDQKSNSVVSVHTFSFGGNITRNNLNFYQNGEHIDSILKGVTIIEGKKYLH